MDGQLVCSLSYSVGSACNADKPCQASLTPSVQEPKTSLVNSTSQSKYSTSQQNYSTGRYNYRTSQYILHLHL